MSGELYACVHAREFPAQAVLRMRSDLRGKPVAILDGRPPLETVCSLNIHARKRGADLNLTRLEAEAIDGLTLVNRSIEAEVSARNVLLECAANFSPRIEDVSAGMASACVLDIAGTEKLFGPPVELARRIRASLHSKGLRASVAVSANFHTARIKAAASRTNSVIEAGEEARALSPLPIRSLHLPDEHAETLTVWGIRTLGELAALPVVELIARLGQGAKVWRDLARGRHTHLLQPIEPAFQLSEFCEFDTSVEQIESLLFIGDRMIDCLVKRAASRAFAIASVSILMNLEGGQTHQCAIRPALPSTDRKFLLKLLQLEAAAHPPPAAVMSLTLSADAAQSSKVQLGLFAPQTPEPSRLDVTIARLKALVGDDRVGSPMLEDEHRPGSFRMEGFSTEAQQVSQGKPARLALRRMRPPIPVQITMRAGRLVAFRSPEENYFVSAAYGPWRASGCWWSVEEWNIEEWDVMAADSDGVLISCVLVCNDKRSEWKLEAFYD